MGHEHIHNGTIPSHSQTLPERRPYAPRYYCDPRKNTECSKTGCTVSTDCYATFNPEYALTDDSGNPVFITPKERITIDAMRALRIIAHELPHHAEGGYHHGQETIPGTHCEA